MPPRPLADTGFDDPPTSTARTGNRSSVLLLSVRRTGVMRQGQPTGTPCSDAAFLPPPFLPLPPPCGRPARPGLAALRNPDPRDAAGFARPRTCLASNESRQAVLRYSVEQAPLLAEQSIERRRLHGCSRSDRPCPTARVVRAATPPSAISLEAASSTRARTSRVSVVASGSAVMSLGNTASRKP